MGALEDMNKTFIPAISEVILRDNDLGPAEACGTEAAEDSENPKP